MIPNRMVGLVAACTTVGLIGSNSKHAQNAQLSKASPSIASAPSFMTNLAVPVMAFAHMVDNAMTVSSQCKCGKNTVFKGTILGTALLTALYPYTLSEMDKGQKMFETADTWSQRLEATWYSSKFMLARDATALLGSTFFLRAGSCIRPNGRVCLPTLSGRFACLPLLAGLQHGFILAAEHQLALSGCEESTAKKIGLALDVGSDFIVAMLPVVGLNVMRQGLQQRRNLSVLAGSLCVEWYARYTRDLNNS